MPCYQERASLETTVAGLFLNQPQVDLLVIDDASPDGTGEIAESLARANPKISVLHRSGKLGLGSAYQAGFEWALARDYELIVEMDADGSHQAIHLSELLAAAEQADLVIGSRWVRGGAVVNWPPQRLMISRLGNGYARLLLRSKIRDLTAGFRVYRRQLLSEITADPIAAEGYAFQVELAFRAESGGARVAEVPITFVEREQGKSKMNRKIVFEALRLVTKWGFRRSFEPKTGSSS
jgi:dolichol-phosphate mannosyltransferase